MDQFIKKSRSTFLHFKKHIGTIVPSLLLVVAGIYWVSAKREGALREYLSVKEAWKKGDFDLVQTFVKKYPELHPTYDGRMAQRELAEGPSKLAEKVAKGTAPFDLFAKTAVTISKGKLKKALAESERLKEMVDPGSDLYGFTLLRIAMLHGELGNKEAEKKAWQEVEASSSFPRLVDHFRKYQISLQQYVATRH